MTQELTPNTQITQENVGLLKAGDVREIATSMNLVLSGSWDEAQDCDWSGKGNEAKLDRLDELLGDLLDAVDRPALSPPAEGEVLESVSPEGLRARASMVRDKLNDSGSCARHLELAADEIERLRTPTPAPVDWNVVGPKLVEALEKAIPTLESDYGEAQDCADEAWIERAWQRLKTARNALTTAQTDSGA